MEVEILVPEKKIDQMIDLTIKAQDRHEKLQEAHEGFIEKQVEKDLEIKQLTDEVGKLMDAKQKQDITEKELKTSVEALEAHLQRLPEGKGSKESVSDKFKKEFSKYARKANRKINEDLVKEYNTHIVETFASHASDEDKDALIKTLSVDSNPDGGYLVFPERNPNVQDVREFETSPVRSVADVITTINESFEEVIDDDESVSGGWVSEQQARPETGNAQFAKLVFVTHEQYAQPKVTQKLLDDASINIESYLSAKTNDILVRTENTAFVLGDGAGKPRGFLDYPAWAVNGTYERGKVEQIASGTNGVYVADTIKELKNSLKGRYQPRANFFIKRDEWQNIIVIKDGQGRYLLDPRSFKEGDTPVLLGKPVLLADDFPVAATDSLSLAYGDFNAGYKIVDRAGIRVLRDNLTDKPFILFYTTKRVGGGVKNFEAFKLYKLGT